MWLSQSRAGNGPDFAAALDLLTGQAGRRISPERAFLTTMPHHRCYRDRATSRYLITGRTGVEFIDLQTGEASRHHWVRGSCQYGVIPANGLLYAPQHSCACYIEAKLTGLLALKPAEPADHTGVQPPAESERSRRVSGPAVAESSSLSASEDAVGDWPTYRHDSARTGHVLTEVPVELKCAWQARIGGRLSAPVIADDRLLVVSVDTHKVYAFDASAGKQLWQYTAAGRIDSPPTIARGLAVFLDDTWWHRTYWLFGEHFYSGYIGWYFAGRESPAGRLLVMDERVLCGFGYRPEFYRTATEQRYHLFAMDRQSVPRQPPADYARANRDYPSSGAMKSRMPLKWSRDVPLLGRALVLAGKTLFVAGPPARALRSKTAYEGTKGAVLCAVSAEDGKTLAEYRLESAPVFDGVAAARGRLYLAVQDGRVLCLGDGRSPGGVELPRVATAGKPTPGVAVEPGLVGHWTLDDGEGEVATDPGQPDHHPGQPERQTGRGGTRPVDPQLPQTLHRAHRRSATLPPSPDERRDRCQLPA